MVVITPAARRLRRHEGGKALCTGPVRAWCAAGSVLCVSGVLAHRITGPTGRRERLDATGPASEVVLSEYLLL
jgi:hypothetical protein